MCVFVRRSRGAFMRVFVESAFVCVRFGIQWVSNKFVSRGVRERKLRDAADVVNFSRVRQDAFLADAIRDCGAHFSVCCVFEQFIIFL